MIGAIGSPLTATERISVGFKEIASGKKSVSTTSPAILAIGQRLLNNSSLASARNSNIINEISQSQTHSSFIQNTQDTVSRISELSVKANSGMLSKQDRQALQAEAEQLSMQLEDNMNNASFNGKKILADDEFKSMVESFKDIDLTSDEGVQTAALASDAAISTLSQRQATIGAEQNILDIQFRANLEEEANLLEAGSRMVDTDMAAALSSLSSDSILSDVSMAMSAQSANLDSQRVSALLS
jgi:flagellin